jgi:hypothetical protein
LIIWVINQIPSIPQIFKTIIYVVMLVILLVWLLEYLPGVIGGPHTGPLVR